MPQVITFCRHEANAWTVYLPEDQALPLLSCPVPSWSAVACWQAALQLPEAFLNRLKPHKSA